MMIPWAEAVTKILSEILELLAVVVIAIALIKLLINYVKNFSPSKQEITTQQIRIKFGSSLTLALELLLGADILITAIAPTWDDIGRLAAIAVLRTALNYFLERELRIYHQHSEKFK